MFRYWKGSLGMSPLLHENEVPYCEPGRQPSHARPPLGRHRKNIPGPRGPEFIIWAEETRKRLEETQFRETAGRGRDGAFQLQRAHTHLRCNIKPCPYYPIPRVPPTRGGGRDTNSPTEGPQYNGQ